MNIAELLNNKTSPMTRLMEETRHLRDKWDKSGLLEGLEGIDKAHMSIMLENQAGQLVREGTQTGTSANSEQWAGVALPLVRRVFAEISAKEFVSVQPMNLPSGLIFYLDFKYGTDQKGNPAFYTQSVFGGNLKKLGSTDDAVNGLYGTGRYTYSMNDTSSAITLSSTASADFYNDLQGDQDYSASIAANPTKFVVVSASLGDNTGIKADLLAGRSYTVSGSGFNQGNVLNEFTRVFNTGTMDSPTYVVKFVMSASVASPSASATLFYTVQPTDRSRGDFEDRTTTDSLTSIGIPELNLDLRSEPIVSKTRKLKAVWTPELAQDLNAYHSIDAEAELTSLLSEYVSMEIDLEIIDMLITSAPGVTTEAWSAKIGVEFNKTLDANANANFTVDNVGATNRTAYIKQTWFQTLGNKIQRVSNKIHQLTLRGGANFLVCSPDVATILESIPGYVAATDGDSAKFAMGVSKVGSFANRFQVYKNPYITENIILIGFRGSSFLETGAVYSPYIPLMQTPLVYDPVNFTPRRGVLTRYAKKVVRPEFFGKIYVADMNAI